MKQRLAIARAVLAYPEFLMLDEPINALDPEGIREMRKLFQRLNRENGTTVFISSHILSEVDRLRIPSGSFGTENFWRNCLLRRSINARQNISACRWMTYPVQRPSLKRRELQTLPQRIRSLSGFMILTFPVKLFRNISLRTALVWKVWDAGRIRWRIISFSSQRKGTKILHRNGGLIWNI